MLTTDSHGRSGSSAELYSAVSRICNPPGVGHSTTLRNCQPPAEWNTAIRQIGNLRYERESASKKTYAARENPCGL